MESVSAEGWHGLTCAFRDRYPSLEESVMDDVKFIKNDPYIPKDVEVIGYVYVEIALHE